MKMKKYKAFIYIKASSKEKAIETLDRDWFEIDPNLDFELEEV